MHSSFRVLKRGSMQRRFLAFAVCMFAIIVVVAVFSIINDTYLLQLQTYTEKLSAINRLSHISLADVDAFTKAITSRKATDYDAWVILHEECKASISALTSLFDNLADRNTYLLAQAISSTFNTLDALYDKSFTLQRLGLSHILVYYDALSAAGYIDIYISQLSHINADSCIVMYSRTASAFSTGLIICVLSSLAAAILTACFFRFSTVNLLKPLRELTSAASHIAGNQLDIPDICDTNTREINQLIHVFNQMKRSMKQSVLHLQQINRMEIELHQRELERVENERLLEQAKLGMLRSQMNPHFLFNTLNMIAGMAEIEDAQTTRNLITQLSSLFRYNLQNPQNLTILGNELQNCSEYIAIQKARFGNRIRFYLDCPLSLHSIPIPVFTLQPLLENSIFHGFGNREDGGSIRIRVRFADHQLQIRVTDNGVGLSRQLAQKILNQKVVQGDISGIGLYTVKKRIETSCPNGSFRIRGCSGFGTTIKICFHVQEGTT